MEYICNENEEDLKHMVGGASDPRSLLSVTTVSSIKMQKKIAKVSPAAFGHLMLEFEDGTKQIVHREDHEAHQPRLGR